MENWNDLKKKKLKWQRKASVLIFSYTVILLVEWLSGGSFVSHQLQEQFSMAFSAGLNAALYLNFFFFCAKIQCTL